MIFQSPYPDVAIPDRSLTDVVLDSAQRRPDKPAFVDGASGRAVTFRQVAEGVRRVAAGLYARGMRPCDVAAIYSPNRPEYAIAFHGCALFGGIVTTVNPQYTAQELAAQLADAGAAYLFTVPELLDRAMAVAALGNMREIFVFGEAEGATPFDTLLRSEGDAPDVPINAGTDVVALPYSSGTTGFPKGVMLTHRNLVSNVLCAIDITPDDILAGVLPFYHIYGLTVIMNVGLYTGATVVTLPRFDLETFLRVAQEHGISYANLVPPIVLALAKHPAVDGYDLSRLRAIMCGGAPLDAAVGLACQRRIDCVVKQGYGLTETSPVTHFSMGDHARPGSIGPCTALTEAKIVDLVTGAELGTNDRGEICVHGPQVMKGYLNNAAATAGMIDAEGWLHTGDVGYADDDGYFYVVDRVKELIKFRGYQVAPAELEAILLSHTSVADAAVVPSPDEEAGEVPKAFVVLRGEATPDDMMRYVADRVAPYKRVRRLEIVETIPKSASGKILRRVLVERERASVSDDRHV